MERERAGAAAGPSIEPTFAPLVLACKRHGIAKTTAFQLVKDGKLETFKIGARTYVLLSSLERLPSRLASQGQVRHG